MRKMIWVLVAIYAAIGLVLWTAPSFAAPEVVAAGPAAAGGLEHTLDGAVVVDDDFLGRQVPSA